jgi:hypothetical protein
MVKKAKFRGLFLSPLPEKVAELPHVKKIPLFQKSRVFIKVSHDLRQSRRLEFMNRSKRIEILNHLKVIIPETYLIGQDVDLPVPCFLYTH